MSNFIKKRKLLSMFSIPLILSPVGIISCSNSINLSQQNDFINVTDQNQLIESANTKTSIYNLWIVNVISKLWIDTFKPSTPPSTTNPVPKQEDIVNFLYPPYSSSTNQNNQITPIYDFDILANNVNKNDWKYKLKIYLLDTFMFYVNFKSSIGEKSQTYFIDKLSSEKGWLKENFICRAKNKSLLDFSPTYNYNYKVNNFNSIKLTTVEKTKIQNDFDILFSTYGTNIFSAIMSMVLAQQFFLNSTKTQIENSTSYVKDVQSNPNYTNQQINDIYNVVDGDYFLVKYLVENTPQFEWSVSRTFINNGTNAYPTTNSVNSFNSLNINSQPLLVGDLLPYTYNILDKNNTISSIADDTVKLNGFKGLTKGGSGINDLSNSIEDLKNFKSLKYGVVYNNSYLNSFAMMDFVKTNPTFELPSINFVGTAYNKIPNDLSNSDFQLSSPTNFSIVNIKDISDKNTNNDSNNNDAKTYKIRLSINYKLASTNPQNPQNPQFLAPQSPQQPNISFIFVTDIFYNKNGVIQNDLSSPTTIDSLLNKSDDNILKIQFSQQIAASQIQTDSNNQQNPPQQQSYLNNDFNVNYLDGTTNTEGQIGYRYIVRVLPTFNSTKTIINDNKEIVKIGKFTLDNTPWKIVLKNKFTNERKKLVNFLFLSSYETIIKGIMNFYLYNDYTISSPISQIQTQIDSIGLKTKTDLEKEKIKNGETTIYS